MFKITIFWVCLYAIKCQQLDSKQISTRVENYDEDQYNCSITSDGIDCYSDNELELEEELKRLSNNLTEGQKHFEKFNLYYSSIEKIPENVFYDMSFDQILIYNTQNLAAIHSKAFISSENSTRRLLIFGTNRLHDEGNDYDLYGAISSLKRLEYVSLKLEEGSEHEIPNNAFRAIEGRQNNLRSIHYFGHYSISSIGEYAFADSPLLSQIIITQIPINAIFVHAFDSRISTEQTLSITLNDCSLTENSFQKGIFNDLKRPIRLYLGDNQIQYIYEDVFGDFFSIEGNFLDLMGNNLECDSIEKFKWLLKRREQLKDRITSAFCKNSTAFWDLYTDDESSGFALTNRFCLKILVSFIIISIVTGFDFN